MMMTRRSPIDSSPREMTVTVLKSATRARKTVNSYIYKIGTAFKCDSERQNWASLHYSHLVSGTVKYQAVQLGAEVTRFLPTTVNMEANE